MSHPATQRSAAELTIAVLGASGFVGRAIVEAVSGQGHQAVPLAAPRVSSDASSVADLVHEAEATGATPFAGVLPLAASADVLINAAGLAAPAAAWSAELVGANSLLPSLLPHLAVAAGCRRVVHVSSAAVYGVGVLDERSEPEPTSPYGTSKSWGEQGFRQVGGPLPVQTVVYRPTSVHGPERQLTVALSRFAKSRFASVAGPGDRQTPQVLVENVASAAVFLATCDAPPERPVLHPWEEVTTAGLLRALGDREPHHLPIPVAASLLRAARLTGPLHPRLRAAARRLEMLWFGQQQRAGWLDQTSWRPTRRLTFDVLGG